MAGLLPPDLEITHRLRLRSRVTDGGSSSSGEHALPGMTCGPVRCLRHCESHFWNSTLLQRAGV